MCVFTRIFNIFDFIVKPWGNANPKYFPLKINRQGINHPLENVILVVSRQLNFCKVKLLRCRTSRGPFKKPYAKQHQLRVFLAHVVARCNIIWQEGVKIIPFSRVKTYFLWLQVVFWQIWLKTSFIIQTFYPMVSDSSGGTSNQETLRIINKSSWKKDRN